MTTSNQSAPPVKSQYHHFVPRFILKNFAHPFQSPKTHGKNKRSRRHEYEPGKYIYSRDPVLNAVRMTANRPDIVELPVKSSLGMVDMYRDISKAGRLQHDLEEELSKLESKAGEIYTKILKAFENGQTDVWLTREERDKLRKFLFVMKYRGPTFYERFNHESIDTYVADDKIKMNEYMKEKGFNRPRDVWFHNLHTILKLKHDLDQSWMTTLPEQMYPSDAMWYIMHTEMMYMALCTPASPDDEFVLTDNCYNVYEGPSTLGTDLSGEIIATAWTSFHEFAPVSPRLMIVLRSNSLPEPTEDSNADIKTRRERYFHMITMQFSKKESLLQHLPIKKAGNSYTLEMEGRRDYAPGEDGSRKREHKFKFSFFPIPHLELHKINSIFFENINQNTTMVLRSRGAFKATLEWYLSSPPEDHDLKNVHNALTKPNLSNLTKLEELLHSMGSTTKLLWRSLEVAEVEVSVTKDEQREMLFQEMRTFDELLASEIEMESEHMKLYRKLGW
jgi:hypothetical protein